MQLVCDNDVKAARIVKGRLEKTTLGQIVEEITQRLAPGQCFVRVRRSGLHCICACCASHRPLSCRRSS